MKQTSTIYRWETLSVPIWQPGNHLEQRECERIADIIGRVLAPSDIYKAHFTYDPEKLAIWNLYGLGETRRLDLLNALREAFPEVRCWTFNGHKATTVLDEAQVFENERPGTALV